MKIVLIAPSGSVALTLNQLGADETSDDITVVSRTAPDAEVRSVLLRPRFAGVTARMEALTSTSALGRNVQRLSPFDAGHRFAGAARRSREFRACVEDADLIAVLERDGILTGWQAARRWAPSRARAVYGVAPAQAIVTAANPT